MARNIRSTGAIVVLAAPNTIIDDKSVAGAACGGAHHANNLQVLAVLLEKTARRCWPELNVGEDITAHEKRRRRRGCRG